MSGALDSCPMCGYNARPLPRRLRRDDNGNDWLVEFWSCSVCPWKQDGGRTTPAIEDLHKKMAKTARNIEGERRRHGQASRASTAMHERLRQRMIDEAKVLGRRVREAQDVS